MSTHSLDVVGLGNAIVDVLSHAEDAFLDQHGLTKGAMALIDGAAAQQLYDRMGPGVECSGGSAANTIAALANLGSRCGFIGRVADDQLGQVFAHDLRALGVHYQTAPAPAAEAGTGRCLVLVTPDAQRTMNTYLGAAQGLSPDDLEADLIAAARITYLEGYLWDPPAAKQAFLEAARLAHQAGRQVALSLSDQFCVERHRDSFLDLVAHHVDILFANEQEICALYQVPDFEQAVESVRGHCTVAALTRSEQGSVVVIADRVHSLAAEPVSRVVDTTGAGDAYAAGFLHAYCQDRDLTECARLGGIAASEVIAHFGARPETNLTALAAGQMK